MNTHLKPILVRFPLIAATAALAFPCFAQVGGAPRATVTFSDGTACTTSPAGPPAFVALSVATKASSPSGTGILSGFRSGAVTFDDITLTRNVDDCSVSLYGLLFKGSHIHTVTIAFQNFVNGAYKDALKLTLAGALINTIADNESNGVAPTERVVMGFDSITIFDPDTGKTVTCDRTRGSCG